MINLIDYILDLFRDEGQAHAFIANPDQALADAGLSSITSAQLHSVASTAVPGLAFGGSGDAVLDLQQAVSNHYGMQPAWAQQPDFSASTDLASNNSFMSPTTTISDNHSVSFGMGDITLGDKTSAHGNGAVAVGGTNHGGIVTGDGAALGNGNTSTYGEVHAASGSAVSVGDGSVISHGAQTITDIHGADNTVGVDHSSTVTHTSMVDNSVHDSSVHSMFDGSVHDSSVHDNSVHDSSAHYSSVHDSAVHGTGLHDASIHDAVHQSVGLDAHHGF
ncbi:IniB N-terminal domain-containing protein [Mycobacterium sp.]|uniref:IniB N-terminal domain-containing protein n=1 Tax=Mycobacterium sp. TaxID=1785 RepID=UPI002D954ECC|nr:IniB N-terminal domain-containing protein [Mycobacterium sp.]